jgi:hypothetical protein
MRIKPWTIAILCVVSWFTIPTFAGAPRSNILVFQGRILELNVPPSIPVSCGVAAPKTLLKYQVERVYVGAYTKAEVLIDHLACGQSGVGALHKGDQVIVIAREALRMDEEVDSLHLRMSEGGTHQYYLALSVGKQIYSSQGF